MFLQGLPNRFKKPNNWLWGHFNNARGKVLRYGQANPFKVPKAHIVYVEGLGEPAEKTFELAKEFNQACYNFSALDRYGQGKSERYFEDQPHKQHNEGVDHDVDDLIQFCKDQIPKNEPIVLLGHSTGGLLALLALEKEPDLFKAAIVTAPLFGIKNALINGKEAFYAKLPLPERALKKYIPRGSDWVARNDPNSHEKADAYASDPERMLISDYWPTKDSDLRAGSATVGWVQEMCIAITKLFSKEVIDKIKHPVLIFSGGEDILVENKNIDQLASQLADAEHHHYKKGKHELLMETDDIRADLMKKSLFFLNRKL